MKVGQEVYIVPYDSRYNPFYSNVINIGKKYITVDNIHKSKNRFRICDYEHNLSESNKRNKCITEIQNKLDILNIEQLEQIYEVIKTYKP